MIKIDMKDRKILYELDTNSRQSFNKIAKKVMLSKDAVKYRIRRLQTLGVIKQFHTIINVGKLGFISFRLYIKLQNTNQKIEEKIIDYLKKHPRVTWLVSVDGEYDLGMWFLTKSIKEMTEFWEDLNNKYLNYIEKKWLSIMTEVKYFPRSYLLDKSKNTDEFVFIQEPEPISLGKKDIGILKLLATDSRIPTIEIADKLNINVKTVKERIRFLENNKIIVGYRTLFDAKKIGYQYFKVQFNLDKLNQREKENLLEYIKLHPNIIYNIESLGGYDIDIEIQTPTIEDLRNLLNEIMEKFSDIIKNYSYMIFYQEHKYIFFPVQHKNI